MVAGQSGVRAHLSLSRERARAAPGVCIVDSSEGEFVLLEIPLKIRFRPAIGTPPRCRLLCSVEPLSEQTETVLGEEWRCRDPRVAGTFKQRRAGGQEAEWSYALEEDKDPTILCKFSEVIILVPTR